MNEEPKTQWEKVATALRESGAASQAPNEDLRAPHGFSTRVVARVQADARADASGLSSWRKLSLAGAACALGLLGVTALAKPAHEPAPQFMPVPALEPPSLSSLSEE